MKQRSNSNRRKYCLYSFLIGLQQFSLWNIGKKCPLEYPRVISHPIFLQSTTANESICYNQIEACERVELGGSVAGLVNLGRKESLWEQIALWSNSWYRSKQKEAANSHALNFHNGLSRCFTSSNMSYLVNTHNAYEHRCTVKTEHAHTHKSKHYYVQALYPNSL